MRSALFLFSSFYVLSSVLCSVSVEIRVLNSHVNIDFLQFQVPFSPEETVIETNHSKILGPFEVEEDAVFLVRALIRGVRVHVSPRIRVSMKNVNANWQSMKVFFEKDVSTVFMYRIPCPKDMYGNMCEVFCAPSDDDFNGHFECGENGEKLCYNGFKGENCTESIKNASSNTGLVDTEKFLLHLTIFLMGAIAYAAILLAIACFTQKSESKEDYCDFYPQDTTSTNLTSVSEYSGTYDEILDWPTPYRIPYAPIKTPELPKSACPSTPPLETKEESLDKSILV